MKSANLNAPKSGQNRRSGPASKLLGIFLFLLLLGHPLFSGNARAQSCCQTCYGNLVTNGDFSQNCQTGYTNTLNYARCYDNTVFLGSKGYSEHNDASAYSSAWEGLDHTLGGGTGFMVIDGPDVTDGPQVAWQQSVSVTGGKNYCFSAWVKNACVVCGPDPTLELRIGGLGGTLIATATPARGTGPNGWTRMCGTYYASSSGTINLTVVISSLSLSGNDALLDDISFGEVCCALPVAPFTYSPKPVVCKQPVTFTSQGFGTSYQWTVNGTIAGTGPSMNYTFTTSGTYIITHTVTNACGSATTQQVITVTCPPANCCDVCGPEKVINGDFSQPCGTGYTSQLTYAPCYNTSVPINPISTVGAAMGGYSEHNDASAYSSAWQGVDHTPGGGSGFMIIDGPDVGYGPKAAWQQSVTGTVGKTYCFSAWVKNACVVCGPDPTLELHINGAKVATVTPPRGSGPNGWTKVCATFKVTSPGPIMLEVVIASMSYAGNDALLDDISFREVCQGSLKPAAGGETLYTITHRSDEEIKTVYPIPVAQGETLHTTYHSGKEGSVTVIISDMAGRKVQEKVLQVTEGNNLLNFSTKSLQPGIYSISVRSADKVTVRKFIVR